MRRITETARVNEFLDRLNYPLRAEMNAVRMIILANKKVEEHLISGGNPIFYYKDYMATFNTGSRKCLTLIFHKGMNLHDPSGLFEGDHTVRRIVKFRNMKDVKAKEANLKRVVNDWVTLMDG